MIKRQFESEFRCRESRVTRTGGSLRTESYRVQGCGVRAFYECTAYHHLAANPGGASHTSYTCIASRVERGDVLGRFADDPEQAAAARVSQQPMVERRRHPESNVSFVEAWLPLDWFELRFLYVPSHPQEGVRITARARSANGRFRACDGLTLVHGGESTRFEPVVAVAEGREASFRGTLDSLAPAVAANSLSIAVCNARKTLQQGHIAALRRFVLLSQSPEGAGTPTSSAAPAGPASPASSTGPSGPASADGDEIGTQASEGASEEP